MRYEIDTVDNSFVIYCEDEVEVESLGLTPNGPFWESVASYLMPELVNARADEVEFDSEAEMFVMYAPLPLLKELEQHLMPLLADPALVVAMAEEAQASGFTFAC